MSDLLVLISDFFHIPTIISWKNIKLRPLYLYGKMFSHFSISLLHILLIKIQSFVTYIILFTYFYHQRYSLKYYRRKRGKFPLYFISFTIIKENVYSLFQWFLIFFRLWFPIMSSKFLRPFRYDSIKKLL